MFLRGSNIQLCFAIVARDIAPKKARHIERVAVKKVDEEITVFVTFIVFAVVHDYIIGSRQVTIVFVVSVCLSVCLFVQSFSQPSLVRFRPNLDICYMSASSCVP